MLRGVCVSVVCGVCMYMCHGLSISHHGDGGDDVYGDGDNYNGDDHGDGGGDGADDNDNNNDNAGDGDSADDNNNDVMIMIMMG